MRRARIELFGMTVFPTFGQKTSNTVLCTCVTYKGLSHDLFILVPPHLEELINKMPPKVMPLIETKP